MRSKNTLIIVLLGGFFSFAQQTITVSGTPPYSTLLDAYDAIQTTNNVINQSYVILIDAAQIEIGDFKNRPDLNGKWKKTGTTTESITIKASTNFYYPKLVKTDIGGITSRTYAIDFDGVENVHVRGLKFSNALAGVHLLNTSDSSIESCIFSIDTLSDNQIDNGGAAIEIRGTVNTNSEANNNIVSSNYIYATDQALDSIGVTGYTKWHGIYIGENTDNNTVKYNSIDDVLGNGIQIWHHEVYNNIQHNFVSTSDFSQDTENKRHNILLGRNTNIDPITTKWNTVFKNFINYKSEPLSSFRGGYDSFSQNGNLNHLLIRDDIKPFNTTPDNIEFENGDNEYAIDSRYFESTFPELHLKMVGAVSGNFHGTSSETEIAVLYDAGNSTSEVHVFQEKSENGTLFLKHLGQWWKSNSGSFDATQLKGRFVAGDFSGTNGLDDIAGLRDLGNGSSSIVLLTANTSGSFSPNGYMYNRWSSNPGSLDANQFTDRLVAGDFTGDGLLDIAGLRDLGSGSSSINLFTGRSDGHFNPSGYAHTRWSSNPGSLNANQFTGRLMAGDFTGDGLLDIAGLRDLGSGSSSINIFTGRSDGHFNPSGYAYTRWSSNTGSLNANQFTGRMVAADFTGDGILDIAGLRDLGNGNATINLFTGGSNGHFSPTGYAYTRWTSSSNEFGNEDLGFFFGRNNSGLRLFLHDKIESKRFRIVSWDNATGHFSKSNGLDLTPFIVDFDDLQGISLRSALPIDHIADFELREDSSLVLYPNPVESRLNLQVKEVQGNTLKVNVYELSGLYLFSKDFILSGNSPFHFEMAIDLPTGIYIVEALSEYRKSFRKTMLVK